jgi:CRP-like cAMP-binding protein
MISLVQSLEDGTTVEVGLIGREGFWGVPLLLGARSSPVEAMVQGAGQGLRMPAAALVAEATRNAEVRELLLRYAQALHTQVAQTAACNGRHSVQRRLARWLLEAATRLESDSLSLSHEFLSYMLGCRRSGVTVALGGLSDDGAVAVKRESITIVDRPALEAASCECYRTVQNEFRRLLS